MELLNEKCKSSFEGIHMWCYGRVFIWAGDKSQNSLDFTFWAQKSLFGSEFNSFLSSNLHGKDAQMHLYLHVRGVQDVPIKMGKHDSFSKHADGAERQVVSICNYGF